MKDVRFDSIGPVNNVINWAFLGGRPRFFRRLISLIFHVELPTLVHSIRLPHPYGVIVNSGAQIGENVTLYQGVTIGSKRGGSRRGVPIIQDDVVIYPNAIVVGAVTVGRGATIGPGSVVHSDVPPGSIFSGNPAVEIRVPN
jgi:serine acetyltransferase